MVHSPSSSTGWMNFQTRVAAALAPQQQDRWPSFRLHAVCLSAWQRQRGERSRRRGRTACSVPLLDAASGSSSISLPSLHSCNTSSRLFNFSLLAAYYFTHTKWIFKSYFCEVSSALYDTRQRTCPGQDNSLSHEERDHKTNRKPTAGYISYLLGEGGRSRAAPLRWETILEIMEGLLELYETQTI